MIYLNLFWSFFQIGLFSIGGGYAAMPLIQNQVLENHHWLTMTEFADIMTIAEMTPGPIAINSATFVGIQVGGIWGAIIATLGCVVPSSIIVMILANIYYRFRGLDMVQGVLGGLRPAVIAMIASAGISLFQMAIFETELSQSMKIDFLAIGIFLAAFLILRIKKSNPIHAMVACGVVGMILYSV